ncbi:MAG: hypothetical protein ABIO70_21065 [Pseudomonadota bacterium]
MDLKTPACNHPDCPVALQERPATARRGPRTVTYVARVWSCGRCADPDSGVPPLEFLDAQLVALNDEALGRAWREKYDEDLPASGRPGRKTDEPKTERVAVLLTSEDMELVDANRGSKSRSEFLREVISERLHQRTA